MEKIIIPKISIFKLKGRFICYAGFLLFLFLFSCVKEGDFEFDKLASNQYDPSIAAPFVSSRISLKELLGDTAGFIQTDNADNSLKIVYDTMKDSKMAKDLFIISDQYLPIDTSNMSISPVSSGDSTSYSITRPYPFTLPKPGQRLDSVYVKTATLKLDINTDVNHSGKIILTTPNITYPDGQHFKVVIPLIYSGVGPIQVYKDVDISSCKITFNNTAGHPNELIFTYEHIIYSDLYPNNSPYKITLKSNIVDITYHKLIGYIGPYDIPVQDIINIPEDNIKELLQYISFNKVGLSADINNSYGLPIDIRFDTIVAIASSGNVVVTNFPTQNPFGINYPSIQQIGQNTKTIIPFQNNPSLISAINKSPSGIIFKVSGKLNPGSSTSPPTTTNFVLDTSKFTVGVHVELPLEGKIAGFVHSDTLEFDLASKLKNADDVTFKINITNSFPLDANVQVYFANVYGQIIDSMISSGENLIHSAIVDVSSHLVTSPVLKLTEVVISKERVRRIENMDTRKLIIKGKLTSFNNGNQVVKLTNANYLDVKIGMKVKINTH